MFNLGVPELIFILVLALLIFGPKRLPEIGRTLGKGLAEFRKASNELKRSIETEMSVDESPRPAVPRLPQRPPAGTAATGTTPADTTSADPGETPPGPPPVAPQ